MTRRALAVAGALAALGLAACGGDDERADTTPTATATAPTATAPATAPPPAATGRTPAPPPGGAEHTGREREREGGDEEPIRVPARFALRAGRLSPASVSVPAYLAIEVTVRSRDAVARTVTVRADRAYVLRVPPGGRARRLVPGQRPGTYSVAVRGGGRAQLVSGGEPGP